MRFHPDGSVVACCANEDFALGHITRSTIGEIWAGAPLTQLREALAIGDYSLGCSDCGNEIAAGNRESTPAAMYDQFPEGVSQWPRRLEFALSNTCNLQCVHCNGGLSSAIRAQREHQPPLPKVYGDPFFAELEAYLPHLEDAVFIGGEPFLMRECRRVWDMLIEGGHRPRVHVTTNGTIWNDDVERYVRELRMIVAVSIDGHTAATNEAIRVGSDHETVSRNRDRLRDLCRETGAPFTVNHCVMVQNWHELPDFLLAAEAEGDPVNLIPVLYPAVDSLFCQPVDRVREVVAALETRDDELQRRLVVNRRAWSYNLDHLRGHLRGLERDGVPIELRSRQAVDGDAALTASRAAVAERTGREPLVVECAWGTVSEIAEKPGWSALLGVDDWIGHRRDDVFELLGRHGAVTLKDLDDSIPGVIRSSIDLERDGIVLSIMCDTIALRGPQGWLVIGLVAEEPAAVDAFG